MQVIMFILLYTPAIQGLGIELSFLTPVVLEVKKCNQLPYPPHNRR